MTKEEETNKVETKKVQEESPIWTVEEITKTTEKVVYNNKTNSYLNRDEVLAKIMNDLEDLKKTLQ